MRTFLVSLVLAFVRKRTALLLSVVILVLVTTLLIKEWLPKEKYLPADTTSAKTTVPTLSKEVPAKESWLRLDALPEDATQVEVGGEIYRLVCSTCHGDRGQGLTQEWITRVEPTEKGCWNSKCHAANHPPDGFTFPRYVPPVAGAHIANAFPTAFDLYSFVRQSMPYHAPNSLTDEEYQYVTLFLLNLNGIKLEETVVKLEDFDEIRLQ